MRFRARLALKDLALLAIIASMNEPKATMLTVKEVGKRLKLSRTTLYRMRKRGELRPVLVGQRGRRYRLADVERWERTQPSVK